LLGFVSKKGIGFFSSQISEQIFAMVFRFIQGLLRENVKTKYSVFLPNLFYIFIIVLLSNVIGMVPYSFTVTSAFVFTFFLAFQHFIGLTFLGVLIHKAKTFIFFLPSGVPFVISPPLSIIELISYIARPFSLGIRLFANMMAGHSLLKILIGFV